MSQDQGAYIGRFQAGGSVPLRLWSIDRSTGEPRKPDKAPWLRVYGASGDTVEVFPRIPTDDFWGILGLFLQPLFLDAKYVPGVYVAVYSYQVNGFTYQKRDQFEVVGGSDPSGSVISFYTYLHPETVYVIAQLSSGRLVLGRNPKV